MSNIVNKDDRLAFLANSIAKAKMVMDKVETNSYTSGHIDREAIYNAPDPVNRLGESYQVNNNADSDDQHDDSGSQYNSFTGQIESDDYAPTKSKMPSAILESFAKNPGNSASFKTVNTTNPLTPNNSQMAALASQVPGVKRQPQPQYQQPKLQYQQQVQLPPQPPVLSEDYIKFIINKTIDETVEKTVKVLLEQLNKPSSLDENIQIKIGTKTFGGKIKTLKG